MGGLNTGYLSTNRGIIKVLQIICGFITCGLLCANIWGGRSCFYDGCIIKIILKTKYFSLGRVGFASSLNFVIVVINVVLFFLNLLNATIYRMERLYSVIGVILFIIAFGIMIWYLIEYEIGRNQLIGATVRKYFYKKICLKIKNKC
ncbi:unnamed protein product [Meloidogyne enterolobii]|uniref:Uncharacterized protein n=1 Tax=Meloidogyne enterolobii TaxID=390850 RepID=A0ACB1AQ06_MELEN